VTLASTRLRLPDDDDDDDDDDDAVTLKHVGVLTK